MARTAVDRWSSLLQLLQQMLQLPLQFEEERTRIGDFINIESRALDHLPPYTQATWHKLVNELKIPYHLASVCCEAQQAASSSNSSSASLPTTVQNAFVCALAALSSFLARTAEEHRILIAISSISDIGSNSIADSITSQLLACDIPAKLPGWMLTVAQQLRDRVTAAQQATTTDKAPRSSSSSSSGPLPKVLAYDNLLFQTYTGLLMCCEACDIWGYLCSDLSLRVQQLGTVPAEVVALQDADVALSLAVLQHDSALLSQLPSDLGMSDPRYDDLLWSSSSCSAVQPFSNLAHWIDATADAAETEARVQQGNAMSAITFLVFVAYAESQLPASIAALNSSSSSSSTGRGAAAVARRLAWAAMQDLQKQRVSDEFRRSMVHTGISVEAAAWKAANFSLQFGTQLLPSAMQGATIAVNTLIRRVKTRQSQQRSGTGGTAQDITYSIDKHTLEHCLLLAQLALEGVAAQQLQQQQHIAASPADTAEDGSSGRSVSGAGDLIYNLRDALELASRAVTFASLADALLQPAAATAFIAASNAAALQLGDHGEVQPSGAVQSIMANWLQPIQPTLLQLMNSLVEQLKSAQVAHSTGSSNSGPAGAAPATSAFDSAAYTAQLFVQLLVDLAAHTTAFTPDARTAQNRVRVQRQMPAMRILAGQRQHWKQHKPVCTALAAAASGEGM